MSELEERLSSSIADRLRSGPVLGAEGYVFELERRGYIKAGPFVPEVVLDYPDAVRELHREFLRAGADVMVALTYYAHREKLRDVGREGLGRQRHAVKHHHQRYPPSASALAATSPEQGPARRP